MEIKKTVKAYTHQEYRKAKIVHLKNSLQEEEFLYQGRMITKKEADDIVQSYMQHKNSR